MTWPVTRRGRLPAALSSRRARSSLGAAATAAAGRRSHAEPDTEGSSCWSPCRAPDVDLAGVTVEPSTAPTPRATAAPAAPPTDVKRTAVLAIDTSDSMKGAAVRRRQGRRSTYLDTVPDTSRSASSPSTAPSRSSLSRASTGTPPAPSSRPPPRPQTTLYDGVMAATRWRATRASARCCPLRRRRHQRHPARRRHQGGSDADVRVDVVSLEQTGEAPPRSTDVADAGQGHVIARPAALTAAFSSEADVLARQVLVTAQVPGCDHDRATPTVAVTLPPTHGRLRPRSPRSAAAPAAQRRHVRRSAPAADPRLRPPHVAMYGASSRSASVCSACSWSGAPQARPPSPPGADRQPTAGSSGRAARPRPRSSPTPRSPAKPTRGRGAAPPTRASRPDRPRLEGPGMARDPPEWLLLHVGIAFAGGLLGVLLGAGNPCWPALPGAIGAVGPWIYLALMHPRRLNAFDGPRRHPAADVRQPLRRMSLAQSIDTIVNEGAGADRRGVPASHRREPARGRPRGRPRRRRRGCRALTSSGW